MGVCWRVCGCGGAEGGIRVNTTGVGVGGICGGVIGGYQEGYDMGYQEGYGMGKIGGSSCRGIS